MNPVLKIGRVEVRYVDALNWAVEGDGQTTYHPTLPGAIQKAIHRALALKVSQKKVTSAVEWLRKYEKLSRVVEKAARKMGERQ